MLAGEIHAGEVDADDLVPDRLRQVVDLAVARGEEDAGIGDEDIEPPEGLDHLPERGLDLIFLADVGRDGDRLAAGLADLGERVLGRVGLPVDDRDLAAFLGKPLGRRLADARPGAGDRGHLALQPTHRPPPKGTRCGWYRFKNESQGSHQEAGFHVLNRLKNKAILVRSSPALEDIVSRSEGQRRCNRARKTPAPTIIATSAKPLLEAGVGGPQEDLARIDVAADEDVRVGRVGGILGTRIPVPSPTSRGAGTCRRRRRRRSRR